MDLVIRGAIVVSSSQSARLDVAVRAGRIAALLAPGTPCEAEETINADGLYILPGLIDAHVHLREPGLVHKETFASGTRSAACGGVTTVLDMPNTVPPVADAATLAAKAALLNGKAQIDVGLYALLGPGMVGRLRELVAGGCVGFKLFLGPTTGNLAAPSWGELLSVFYELSGLGVPVVVHAEDREMIEYYSSVNSNRGGGYTDFLSTRPEIGEVAATAQVCRLAGETGVRVHIAHVSLASAVEVIASAKAAGWPVTAETCPPYMFLTADDYERTGTQMKVLPPVRHAADRQTIWEALHCGVLDMVATDHAPHAASDKGLSIWEAASGAPGVETMLPLLLDAANRGKCTLTDIARWCAAAPAASFGLPGKGNLNPGDWADITIVDMGRSWEIQASKLQTMAGGTPFNGWHGVGAPVQTILRGKLVAKEGQPVGEPAGRFIQPCLPPGCEKA